MNLILQAKNFPFAPRLFAESRWFPQERLLAYSAPRHLNERLGILVHAAIRYTAWQCNAVIIDRHSISLILIADTICVCQTIVLYVSKRHTGNRPLSMIPHSPSPDLQ